MYLREYIHFSFLCGLCDLCGKLFIIRILNKKQVTQQGHCVLCFRGFLYNNDFLNCFY